MQSKLKLNLEDLSVDSFDTVVSEKPKGTVFGEQCTCYTNCTCPGCPSCYESCNGTCDASCNGTCAASCNGTCNCPSGNTCDWSCQDCSWGYTCNPCTALQTNCNQVCL